MSSAKVSVVVPEASFLLIVVEAGKLVVLAKPKASPNASFEEKVGTVGVFAYGDATRHRDFSAVCREVRKALKARAVAAAAPTEPAAPALTYCHYHKAEVGHSIDACPDVTCRTCRRKGHTDRVCTTPQCTVCSGYGHAPEKCRRRACTGCGRTGHSEDACYQNKPAWCSYHQTEGDHHTSECPDLKDWECENCGEKGHYFKNCHNPHIVRVHRRPEKADVNEDDYIFASGNSKPLHQKRAPQKLADA